MVMGNASGRDDGEGTSGEKKNEYEEGYEQSNPDPMLQSPPSSPGPYRPPFMLSPQIPMAPLTIPGNRNQASKQAVPNARYIGEVHREKKRAAMIIWSHGGKQVAITGSWDNWETMEPLHPLGRDYIIMKMLPPGIYHYRFIIDEQMKHAPNLPWECDIAGSAYNILDLQSDESETKIYATNSSSHGKQLFQEFVPQALESLAEFESPPSPISSYDNEPLNDDDFSKNPPELPPQLKMTLLNDPSSTNGRCQTLQRPHQAVLNHLYIQNSDGNLPLALGFTHRFLQKYVTVVIYKSSLR